MSRSNWIRGYVDAAPGFMARQRKNLGHVRYGWNHPKQVSFVFGCQRSGTKMLMRILDNCPAIRIYHENHASAFHDFQLRSDTVLRALVATSPAPCQVFKPICDSQHADSLLERFPAARGLWMYRNPNDVANSALEKWGKHQLEVIAAVARGETSTSAGEVAPWGWRTARIPAEVVAEIRRVYRGDLSESEGALLFWYLRNSFVFSLALDKHPRMRLCKYERLVESPIEHFPPVFAHIGADFSADYVARVRADSVGRATPPVASDEIRALCDGLLARLDACIAPAPVISPLLILINTLGVGGAEKHAVSVANWFSDHGADVTVAASGGDLVPTLRPAVKFVDAPFRRVRADLPAAATLVRQLIRTAQPAAILANSLAMTLIARAAQPTRGLPIVNIAHGWPVQKYGMVGKLLLSADRVVAVSPDVKHRLVEGGLSPTRCTVIENGVDCTNLGRRTGMIRSQTRASLGATEDAVLVVTLGRLTPQKAHHHVITLAKLLRERHPQLRYAILGEGARAAELQAFATSEGVADLVCLAGLRTDTANVLGSADIYLSCSDWEGMPLSTIEAMASRLPTVATQTEGSGQLLTEGCGLVVPIGNVEAMANALSTLVNNPDLRQQIGEAANKRARARFGHERMMSELAAVLANLTTVATT